MVQTLTHMIHSRLRGLEKEIEKWVDTSPSVLKKYTSMVHSTTGFATNEAMNEDDHMEVLLNISNNDYGRPGCEVHVHS